MIIRAGRLLTLVCFSPPTVVLPKENESHVLALVVPGFGPFSAYLVLAFRDIWVTFWGGFFMFGNAIRH